MAESAFDAARKIGPFDGMQITPLVDDSDLVSTPVDFRAGAHTMQFHNGLTIAHPKLVVVRVGPTWWGDWAKFVTFCTELMTRGYLSQLTYAGCSGGAFVGSYEGPALAPGTYSDAQLQQYLQSIITANMVPGPDGSTIYSLMLPDGVVSQLGGSSSCSAYCGYHSSMMVAGVLVLYTIQPASDCQGCNQGDPFVGATMVEGHEVAETISDPTGQGWYEDSTGMENADIVAWIQKTYGPWVVQGYADPAGNNVLGAYVAAPPPVPQPPPPPPVPQPPPSDLAPRVAALESAVAAMRLGLRNAGA